jgi:hypothetical protein
MSPRPMHKLLVITLLVAILLPSCLPPSDPYPFRPPAEVVADAENWSKSFERHVERWTLGQVSAPIPDNLIPKGVTDSKKFYLKNPDQVTAAETWAFRYAKPIDKDSLYAGIPDPRVTYLFLGTCLAPFGSKLVIEGEFPHCRFFSIQASPPINGKEYYSQRVYGPAEVGFADSDIEPLPGNVNPFRPGANRNASNRKYRVEFDLRTGDPVALNAGAHTYPYRSKTNSRAAAMLTFQGPLGHKSIAGTDLPIEGDWNLGALWIRIYAPDDSKGPLGGVPMPKAWFELPNGKKYFVGSDFSELQRRADLTIANRVVAPQTVGLSGPETGWFKSWGITRSILNGVCGANNWSRPDSGARVAAIDLGWTGRGEFQPAPANIEPHATTNNYASYLGRTMTVAPGMVAVLTGKLPTFPQTRKGESTMQTSQVRYWSICGIDQDPLSPLPATTIHAISDDEVTIDQQRNYIIAYSRPADRPQNATAANGVSWVDWGTQSTHGVLMRWVCVSPEWNFSLSPHENHLDWAHSDWAGSKYDSTLIGVNWRRGFMQCYLPKVHYMTVAEFESLGNQLRADQIPVWIEDGYRLGPSEAQYATVEASSRLDNTINTAPANVNDGDYSKAWASAFGQAEAQITLDLGAPKVISGVKLFWDWIFFARVYSLQTSNDRQNWTDVRTVSNGDGAIDLLKNLQNVKARYLRVSMKQSSSAWYGLGEIEVFTNDCDCEAPIVSAPNPIAPVKLALRVSPNPARDHLLFEWAGETPETVQIIDLSGRTQTVPASENGMVNLRGIAPGTYVLRVNDEKKRFGVAKFVVY